MAAMAEVQKYKMQVERFELFREDIEDLVKLTVDKMDLGMHLDVFELACTHMCSTYAHIDVTSRIGLKINFGWSKPINNTRRASHCLLARWDISWIRATVTHGFFRSRQLGPSPIWHISSFPGLEGPGTSNIL